MPLNLKNRDRNIFRDAREPATLGQIFESLFYELKPVFFTLIAIYAIQAGPTEGVFVKFNAMVLVGAAVYISYSRLVYRGHLR